MEEIKYLLFIIITLISIQINHTKLGTIRGFIGILMYIFAFLVIILGK